MAEVCPITVASPEQDGLRYIHRSAWVGVARGGEEPAEQVGVTLATLTAERRIQHYLNDQSDMATMGCLSSVDRRLLYDEVADHHLDGTVDFLSGLGYYNADGDLVPLLSSTSRITAVCHDKGYDTLALGTDRAAEAMRADNIPMEERKADPLPGLVIVSGADVEPDASGEMLYEPLVVLPPRPAAGWRIKHVSPAGHDPLDPAEVKAAEQWARLKYRRELLGRIADVSRFLERYRTGPEDADANARARALLMSKLGEELDVLLLRPSLDNTHYKRTRALGEMGLAFSGARHYVVDPSDSAAA